MLNELKFVQGAISRKDFVPALKHFVIENGTVRGYNGTLALCTPIPFDLTCKPKAEPLVKAIANCTETVQLALTKGGRLCIKSGKFKAFIDCIEGETPHVSPEGVVIAIDGAAMLAALKTLYPFIGDDASRPWAGGVLLKGQSAYATNNVSLVEYWTGTDIPQPLNIPRDAVKEMLRIGEAPESAQLQDNSLTFHYSGSRWIRTQLLSVEWPDLAKVLNRESKPLPIQPEIFEGLQIVKPFLDKIGRVLFRDGGIHTHVEEGEGASYDIENFSFDGAYALDKLILLEGVARTVDWSTYPGPCMFFGDRLRGALIGMVK